MRKQFNPLIDRTPESVTVNGRYYRIETDYRTVLAYMRLIQDQDTEDQDKTILGLSLFYGDNINPEDIEYLAAYLRHFINRGAEQQEDETAGGTKPPKIFDLLADSGRIFAAFIQIYKINLRKASVHWWIFCELLEGLPDEGTKLAAVIDIRRREYAKHMTPAERNSLARLKEFYKIEETPDVIGGLFGSLLGIAS